MTPGRRRTTRATRTGILVAGMHRSGTSALTRVLTIAGCDLPGTLVEAKPDNAAGFWESQPIVDLNDEMLASAGSCWDDWRPFERDWYESAAAGPFRDRALEVLRQEYGESRLFVLKDPRICRLLPFWTDALSRFEARVCVVSPIRNPLDVAASLEARNGIHPSVAYLIWLRHVLDAEADSRGLPRAHVRYDQLLSDAPSSIDRVCQDLGVSLPRRGSPLAETDIDAFLSPDLRHHHRGDDGLLADASVSEWVRSSFRILDCWTRGEADDEHTRELDRIRTTLDAATPAFGRALQADQQAARECCALARELLTVSETLETTRQAIAERDHRLDEQNLRVTDTWKKLETTRQTLTERNQEVTDTWKKLETTRQTLTERNQEVTDTWKKLETTRQTLTERNQEVTDTWKKLEAARTLTERNQEVTDTWKKLETTRQTLTERNQEVTDTWKKLETTRQTLTERNQEVTDTWKKLETTRQTLTERNQEVTDTWKKLETTRQTLTERNQEVTDTWKKLEAARHTLTERNQRLTATWQQLETTRRSLTERGRLLSAAEQQLETARQRLAAARHTVAEQDARIAELTADLDAARRGHRLVLARRGRRLGFDRLEIVVQPTPEWLDEARGRGPGPALELCRNGRVLARLAAPDAVDDTLRIPVPPSQRGAAEAVYSVHDAATGAVLAALAAPAFWRARGVEGAVESRGRPEIRGWVLDPHRPQQRRRVAFEIDGRLRDVIVAGDPRDDIAGWKGTEGRHGFFWPIPAPAAEGTQVDVFDADTGRPLRGSPVRVQGGKVAADGADEA